MTIFHFRMKNVVQDYFLASSQLRDPRIWKPVLWAILLSLGTIFVMVLLAGGLLFQFVGNLSSSLTGWMSWADGWLGGLAAVFGSLFIAMVGYFFLASVYAAFLGLFLDSALDAVQQEHYPDNAWEKPPGMVESSISSLRFILWSLVVYLLCSPLLLVAFFIPPLGLLLQILLGGFLLGREFGQVIEHRIPRKKRMRKPGSLVHGSIASFLWMFPLVNFLAPMLLATSLVHARLRRLKTN